MSEKIPQANSHESQPKTYLVPRSNGEYSPATLTGRERHDAVRQRDGSMGTVKFVEVRLPDTVDENGNTQINTKMVANKLLSDGVQSDLTKKAQELQAKAQDVQVGEQEGPMEEVAAPNEYDALYADNYDESDYSVEAAAERSHTPEVHTPEMLEYADAMLSRALRADTDLQQVIVDAFSQAAKALPAEKEVLIKSMGTDARIRENVRHYLRAKAEYYRSDLPERIRANTNKTPNFPGEKARGGLEVATDYAVRMITGEWDEAREDGVVETDAAGNVIRGQHRAAAHAILTSPHYLYKEQ